MIFYGSVKKTNEGIRLLLIFNDFKATTNIWVQAFVYVV